MRREIRKFANLTELSSAAAAEISGLINETVRLNGSFSMALSGGNTPRPLYHVLGTEYRDIIPWDSVHLFWGDERYVPKDDGDSNYRMAKESLLDLIPVPDGNVHRIRTEYSIASEAATAYDKELHRYFGESEATFDLVLLGMGKEGHTASMFPASPALAEKVRWALTVEVPATPSLRITLTLPVLNRAAAVYFLVSGDEKADALRRVFDDSTQISDCPAKGIRPAIGAVTWWTDSAIPASL